MLNFGILGMNARNLSYIKKFNTKKAIRLADNKLKTKRFVQARWIPVPRTFDVIKTPEQLWRYDFARLPTNEFIIKPAKGSRWRGIYRVKHMPQQAPEQPIKSFFEHLEGKLQRISPTPYDTYRVSWQDLDDTTFRRYLLDIIYGKNSLWGTRDQIIIEELLIPGEWFEQYCQYGLADIRIIAFNLIPVAAMLRVPTEASDGKANLDRWALWMGVEVGSWKIYAMYQDWKIHHGDFPSPYNGFANRMLPYRNEILSFSSKVQYFTNMGFLALDWVITEDGPKLLEINARAWLKFQLATQLPLRSRLKKIEDVKVVTPEKWVEIAQTLFSHHKAQIITPSKVLYLSQYGKIHLIDGDERVIHDCIVDIDVMKRNNYLSKDLFERMQESTKSRVILSNGAIKISGLEWRLSQKLKPNNVLLWREAVADYYVKPIHRITTSIDFINPRNIQEAEIDQMHILDKKIASLGYKLNTSKIFTPTNYLAELDSFITWKGKYNPYFEYKWPSEKRLQSIEDELRKLKDQYFGASPLQSKFAKLFEEKIDELLLKHKLIIAYKAQNIKGIVRANQGLYGVLDDALVTESQQKFLELGKQPRKKLWPVLKRHEIEQMIKEYLDERNIANAKVVFENTGGWRISIRRGRIISIRVSETGTLRRDELLAALAHEIDIHVQRYNAWLATGWNIMKSGTAGYIKDEEGLAILASEEHFPEWYEKIGMYQKYYLLSMAGEKSFADLAGIIYGMSSKSLLGSFNGALRMKKWLRDTANRWGAVNMKGKIYLDGYTEMKEWIEQWGDVKKLMIGKVKRSDLKVI